MTYRDFFRVAIKLFTLFVLVNSLMSLFSYNLISLVNYMSASPMLIIGALSIILIGLYILLIKNPDLIINLLNLDKGFDEEKIFTSKTSASTLLKLA